MMDFKSVPEDYLFVSWRPEMIKMLQEAEVPVYDFGVSKNSALHVPTWAVPKWTALVFTHCSNHEDLQDLFWACSKCDALVTHLMSAGGTLQSVGAPRETIQNTLTRVISVLRGAPTKEVGLRNLRVSLAASKI